MGNSQIVNSNEDIEFDIGEDYIDIVGTGITLDETGKIFTIERAGLYHIEWSINIASASFPVTVGLLENGAPSSALSNNAVIGNYSSGALINVEEGNIPYTISLHNFGGDIELQNPEFFQNTAASIRILRFADGAV